MSTEVEKSRKLMLTKNIILFISPSGHQNAVQSHFDKQKENVHRIFRAFFVRQVKYQTSSTPLLRSYNHALCEFDTQ